ncbi:MAG: WD40 repeat domain-containing protein [Planctomycetota bacterium]
MLSFFVGVVAVDRADAQCGPRWLSGHGVPGVAGTVLTSCLWDPDGAGPAQPLLAVGGSFQAVGNTTADRVASLDLATGEWRRIGAGIPLSTVHVLLALPNGDLVAGGLFQQFGPALGTCVARWDGTSWSPLGDGLASGLGGFPGQVDALALGPNQELVAAVCNENLGRFAIAQWNGLFWATLGGGSGTLSALSFGANGDLYVGGLFAAIAGVPAANIARWDGAVWSALGNGTGGQVRGLQVLANGDLEASGWFDTAGGAVAFGVAQWNGAVWTASAPGSTQRVYRALRRTNGQLLAVVLVGSNAAVARWSGVDWQPLGGTSESGGASTLLELPGGDLFAGGLFDTIGGVAADSMARWDGVAWSALAPGFNRAVLASLALADGGLLVGGGFAMAGDVPARGVARRDGDSWSALGNGLDGGDVLALAQLPGGDLIAAGSFTRSGGQPLEAIARWDGVTWSPLGAGITQGGVQAQATVNALAVLPGGDLVVGGDFRFAGGVPVTNLARWDGTSWSPFGSGADRPVRALSVLPDGRMVVGGDFWWIDGLVARHVAVWDGSTWDVLPSTVFVGTSDPVLAIAALPDSDFVVGGRFAQRVLRRHDGGWISWPNRPSGDPVNAIVRMPGGDLLANAGLGLRSELWRLSGGTWSRFASNAAGQSLGVTGAGSVVIGTDLSFLGGRVHAGFAELSTTCPSLAMPYGIQCPGGAGPVSLTTEGAPWLGDQLQLLGAGYAPRSLAILHLGLANALVPLAAIHPAGVPGCNLLVAQDVLTALLLPSGSEVPFAVPVPADPRLAQLALFAQMTQIEFDPALTLVRISGSNGLQMTLGSFLWP